MITALFEGLCRVCRMWMARKSRRSPALRLKMWTMTTVMMTKKEGWEQNQKTKKGNAGEKKGEEAWERKADQEEEGERKERKKERMVV